MPLHAEPIVIVDEGPRPFTTNTPAGTWAAMPVTFFTGPPASRDVGAEAGSELEVALHTWSHVACTSFRGAYGGDKSLGAADDGTNMVLFHDDAWPAELEPGVVAQTVVHVDATGHYRDADVHLNGKDFRFSLDGSDGTQDLRSVLVHELGHALGLGHSTDARATMFVSVSGLRWRSLEKDDVDGVCALYPGTGAPGCDAVPCPSSHVCVAGTCQRKGDRADVCSPCARVADACEAAGDDARCIDLAGGRVCGRACTNDAACGAGFHCKATSAAGDLQCVSDDGCRSAASPCHKDADCTESVCRDGACVGPRADVPDAAASADASPDAPAPNITGGGGGCSCRASPSDGTSSIVALALALAGLRRKNHRR